MNNRRGTRLAIQALSSPKRRGFVPPRLLPTLPPLVDMDDIALATKLRSAIRRGINRGNQDVAARFAGLSAILVRRRSLDAEETL